MNNYYVPSTEEIKGQACRLGGWSEEAFDRWLAEHDAQVLRAAATEIRALYFGPVDRYNSGRYWGTEQAAKRLEARANRLVQP